MHSHASASACKACATITGERSLQHKEHLTGSDVLGHVFHNKGFNSPEPLALVL